VSKCVLFLEGKKKDIATFALLIWYDMCQITIELCHYFKASLRVSSMW
jgi:hypothetical protein